MPVNYFLLFYNNSDFLNFYNAACKRMLILKMQPLAQSYIHTPCYVSPPIIYVSQIFSFYFPLDHPPPTYLSTTHLLSLLSLCHALLGFDSTLQFHAVTVTVMGLVGLRCSES